MALKSAVAIAAGDQTVMSEHLGDLENPAAYRNFVETGDRLRRILRVEPEVCACDLHPQYHSSGFAQRLGICFCPPNTCPIRSLIPASFFSEVFERSHISGL